MKLIKKLVLLGLFLVIVFLPCISFAIESGISAKGNKPLDKYEEISALLFPETQSWKLVSQMQPASVDFLHKIAPDLKKVYLSSMKIGQPLESEGCSFIGHVFSKEGAQDGHFYISDVDGNGSNDIVYTGSSQCTEADITLIWFASSHGYVIKQRSLFATGLAVRIKEGNPLFVSAVASGCCEERTDEYLIETLPNLKTQSSCWITKDTYIPKNNHQSSHFVAAKDLVLRSSPIKNDKYDKEQSDLFGIAMMGNVISKYLPGCFGNVVGIEQDKNSTVWSFVVLDKACERLRSYSPYNVNVGWVSLLK